MCIMANEGDNMSVRRGMMTYSSIHLAYLYDVWGPDGGRQQLDQGDLSRLSLQGMTKQ